MRKIISSALVLCISTTLVAQNYPGYRSFNHTGVNGVFSNPANIADGKHRWDVNLFSLSGNVGNNQGSFSLSNLSSAFGDNVDSVFLGSSSKETKAMAAAEIVGPSIMFSIGRKNSFAITTRVRVLANINDLDGNIIQSIDDENDILPVNLNSNNNQKLIMNGWSEIGGSFGRVLVEKGPHFLKGGITLKYLMGSANSFANIDKLKGTLDDDVNGDVFLTNASGRVAIGISGVDFDNAEGSDYLKSYGKGVGFDLGLVYEYRPADSKGYKYKIGLSLLDLGSVRYTPKADEFGDYTINVPNGAQWYPSDLDNMSISEIKNYLDASPYFTNNSVNLGKYKANLPTTVQANVDWNLSNNFYAELAGQLSVVSKTNIYSSFYYNAVTLTPRYEGRRFGVALPINYNALTNFNMGLALRAGPVFIGSGSFLSALIGQSKQADLYFGIRFGGLRK